MAPKVLFSKLDVFNAIESQKQRLKDAYLRLPEDQAMNEEVIRRIKSEYMFDVPVLKTGEMYCVEGKTQVDVSRMPNRIFFGSGPVMEDATELTVHIPFDGDPGVFNIAPQRTTLGSQRVRSSEMRCCCGSWWSTISTTSRRILTAKLRRSIGL